MDSLSASEYSHALGLIKKSQQNIDAMFSETRLLNLETAMSVVEDIYTSVIQNAGALMSFLRFNRQGDMHAIAVCSLMIALAKALQLSETEIKQAGLAGLMHDVGKVLLPSELLNKPSRLTDEEYALVMTHPEKGYHLLLQAGIADPVTLDVCMHHHEKIDGTGYPKNLTKDEIGMFVKMAAVCDVYDAIAITRPYKLGWGAVKSFESMLRWEGHFDQEILDAFVQSVIAHPVGSIVLLKSDRLAVVVNQSVKDIFKPIVKVFFSIKTKDFVSQEYLDLSDPEVLDEIIEQGADSAWELDDFKQIW